MSSFQRILDTTPANIPGVEFMTRSTVSGYQVTRLSSLALGGGLIHQRFYSREETET